MSLLYHCFVLLFCASAWQCIAGIPQKTADSFAKAIEGATAENDFVCPEESGFFEDPLQCDKYWECTKGRATPHLCDDGLVFDILKADVSTDPCDSPFVINCDLRTEIQEPTFVSEFCPRRHGIFADPDPSVCDRYYTCKEGRHTMTPCAPGLHFHEENGICAWPVDANRVGCGEKKRPSVNGFTCPEEEVLNDLGVMVPHPSYPNLDDCQKFYVCLRGKTPQEAACDLGKVFNEKKMLCEFPNMVPECIDWYKGDPRFDVLYDDADGDGLVDFGDRRDFSQTSINGR